VAIIYQEGSDGVPPYAKGKCPTDTIPNHSIQVESEVKVQDPSINGSASPIIPRRMRRYVWIVALCLVAMITSTFLVLQSGKMYTRMFPPAAPDEFNRSGVSAVVLHEWQNARADHEAIAFAVAQCFDWGDAYVFPGFLNKQLMLDMGPNGDRLPYKTREEENIKSLKLPSLSRAAIYLSDGIIRARMELAGVISYNDRVMRVLNIALIIIGAVTTTLISVKATAGSEQMKSRLYQTIGIAAIVLSALGTVVSGLNSFYNPQEKYTRNQKSLDMLKQLHVEVATAVSSQELDICREKMKDDSSKKVKEWSTRLAGIWNTWEITAQNQPRPDSISEPPTPPNPGNGNDPGARKSVTELSPNATFKPSAAN
jgi:hypothetical protein